MHWVYTFQDATGLLEIINLRELELSTAQMKNTPIWTDHLDKLYKHLFNYQSLMLMIVITALRNLIALSMAY